ncbi:MAG: DNA-binding protein WhiA [Bacillota bacterium]|nr:DNA-binding protein WhiA [Bacillota bacterium]
MTFSNEVRNELARIIPAKKCCKKAELSALLSLKGTLLNTEEGFVLTVVMENAITARKVFKLLKECYDLQPAVRIKEHKRFKRTRVYVVETILGAEEYEKMGELWILDDNGQIKRQVKHALISKNCCRRAYLRGVFICKGFINRPEGNYHMEMVLNDTRLANDIQKMLMKFELEARQSERKSGLIVYIKDSEKIVDFLRLVEASKALLDFENVRIIKSMRNQVNRQVNCETANLAKTVDASIRQVELIENLLRKVGVQGLPKQFRDIAMLRIDYPDFTLKELGEMMDPPLTKSGAAYRMKKMEEYAEDVLTETSRDF